MISEAGTIANGVISKFQVTLSGSRYERFRENNCPEALIRFPDGKNPTVPLHPR